MKKGMAVNSNHEIRPSAIEARRKRESGVALLFSMLLLFLLATLAFSSMDSVKRDAQIVGAKKSSDRALQMADAGVADAMDLLYNRYAPVSSPEIGDTIDPAIWGDIDGSFVRQGNESRDHLYALAANTIMTMRGLGEPCNVSSDFDFNYGIWDVQVQGFSTTDALSRSTIHISVLKCQCISINNCGD